MTLRKVSSLDSSQIQLIKTMVNACTDADGTSLSFPFDEADLFLYFEHNGAIVSAMAFIPVEDLLYECSAFTDLEFRGQGLFSELLNEGIEELPEDSELIFYSDKKNTAAAAVLETIGAELDSQEHMMELLPEDFSTAVRRTDPLKSSTDSSASDIDIHPESLDIDGTLTLRFHSDHAVINFSVFPSHYYLYGFEVEETCRGMGYGTKFLNEVLTQLLEGTVGNTACVPAQNAGSGTESAISVSAVMDPRPVLLQVSGSNDPALALYKKTGFRITETLCCYLY